MRGRKTGARIALRCKMNGDRALARKLSIEIHFISRYQNLGRRSPNDVVCRKTQATYVNERDTPPHLQGSAVLRAIIWMSDERRGEAAMGRFVTIQSRQGCHLALRAVGHSVLPRRTSSAVNTVFCGASCPASTASMVLTQVLHSVSSLLSTLVSSGSQHRQKLELL